MNTVDLKNVLIKRISKINDVTILGAIQSILDSNKETTQTLHLTSEQKEEIMASKADVKKGLTINQDELDREVLAWLKEK